VHATVRGVSARHLNVARALLGTVEGSQGVNQVRSDGCTPLFVAWQHAT